MSESDACWSYSEFGQRWTQPVGIVELMEDLGHALTTASSAYMLGGGNPAAVPQLQQIYGHRMQQILSTHHEFSAMLGHYDPPQGNPYFLEHLARLLKDTYGWEITSDNIVLTTGGQTAAFLLFNLFAGMFSDQTHRKIVLPVMPEYIGYAPQGITPNMFVSCPPLIETHAENPRVFRYDIDWDALEETLSKHSVGALALSRPTNPSTLVLNQAIILRLLKVTRQYGIPLILDEAYGHPFPGIVFTPDKPFWTPEMISIHSLSKLGLPGVRTAIVLAPAHVARSIARMMAVLGLANVNIGQQLLLPFVKTGELLSWSADILQPYYRKYAESAFHMITQIFSAYHIDWRLHEQQGAFFSWLWFPSLQITTQELYQRLKQRQVLIVPGEYFFYGLQSPVSYAHQCIRINHAQPERILRPALEIIAQEVRRASS